MHPHRSPQLLLLTLASVQLLASPCFAQGEPYDPWERTNRVFFSIQNGLDRAIIGPAAHAYSKLPNGLRRALRNVTRNLGEPLIFVNDALQGHAKTAAGTASRFALNSTVGLVGLVDVAKRAGIPYHDNDFGLTMGRWGADAGPYLFLPVFGPSSFRDGLGWAADIGLNPFTYAHYHGKPVVTATTTLVNGLDRRVEADQELKTVRETSTDPYATIRSYYLQSREAQIRGPSDIGPLPSFDDTTAPGAEPSAIGPLPSFDETPAPGAEPSGQPTEPPPTPTEPVAAMPGGSTEAPGPPAAGPSAPSVPPAPHTP